MMTKTQNGEIIKTHTQEKDLDVFIILGSFMIVSLDPSRDC